VPGLRRALKWQKVGALKPTQGRELDSSDLASALVSKTEFTQQEWERERLNLAMVTLLSKYPGIRRLALLQIGLALVRRLVLLQIGLALLGLVNTRNT